MRPLFIRRKGEVFLGPEPSALEDLNAQFQKFFPDISPKYIDPLSLMAGVAAAKAWGMNPGPRRRAGISP